MRGRVLHPNVFRALRWVSKIKRYSNHSAPRINYTAYRRVAKSSRCQPSVAPTAEFGGGVGAGTGLTKV